MSDLPTDRMTVDDREFYELMQAYRWADSHLCGRPADTVAAFYPADWKQIRARILERAGNACEGSPDFPDCRVPNGEVGYREDYGRVWIRLGANADEAGLAADAAVEDGERVTIIVLTIGHLDHTPENCGDDNLRAWCQRCHLHYDRQHHNETAYATRRAGRAIDMWEDDDAS